MEQLGVVGLTDLLDDEKKKRSKKQDKGDSDTEEDPQEGVVKETPQGGQKATREEPPAKGKNEGAKCI